jgi:hypothetical protein
VVCTCFNAPFDVVKSRWVVLSAQQLHREDACARCQLGVVASKALGAVVVQNKQMLSQVIASQRAGTAPEVCVPADITPRRT